jgi:hypothetical protein
MRLLYLIRYFLVRIKTRFIKKEVKKFHMSLYDEDDYIDFEASNFHEERGDID